MVKPVNKVLVSIPQAFEEEIVTEGGFKLYKDSSYQKEWNATVTGTISHLSDLVSEENKPIYDLLDIGTEIACDYKVVADFDYISDEKHFHCVTPENSLHLRKYTNKIGQWISVRSMPNPKGVVASRVFSVSGEPIKGTQEKIWVGWLQDKYMTFLDGIQGDEARLENWLAQFSFGKIDSYYFRNKVYVQKQPHWVCDFEQIIAYKKMGEWVAMSPYVMMCPLDVDMSKKVSISAGGIHIPESAIKMRFFDRAIHLNGAIEIGIQKHEVIAFQEKYLIKYLIENREYFFIKKQYVDGTYPVS